MKNSNASIPHIVLAPNIITILAGYAIFSDISFMVVLDMNALAARITVDTNLTIARPLFTLVIEPL